MAADEILLATETIDQLGLELGDTVTAVGQVGDSERPDVFQDTSCVRGSWGSVWAPPISGSADTESRLGRGAVTTVPGLQRLNPVAGPTALYVQFDADTDHTNGIAALRRVVHAAARSPAGVRLRRRPGRF